MRAKIQWFQTKTHTQTKPQMQYRFSPLKLENSFKKETSKLLPVRKCKPAYKSVAASLLIFLFGVHVFSHFKEKRFRDMKAINSVLQIAGSGTQRNDIFPCLTLFAY